MAVLCMACGQSGLYSNHQDIDPRYAGLLLGLSNTAGVLTGVFGTAATGYILQHGCVVGGSSGLDKERRDDDGDECFLVDIPFPIPAQDIPFRLFPAADAECIRIALNLIAYLVAAHAVGGCWYLLGIQRATKCLNEQCMATKGYGARAEGCISPNHVCVFFQEATLGW